MAICLNTVNNPSGTLIAIQDPQPSDISTCNMLLISAGEYQNSFGAVNPFALTVQEGAQLGGSILLVMAVAWVIRQFADVIKSSSKDEN